MPRRAYEIRKHERRLSLRAVEEAIGVDHTSIFRFERGGFMREDSIKAYADFLGVTVDELLAPARYTPAEQA